MIAQTEADKTTVILRLHRIMEHHHCDRANLCFDPRAVEAFTLFENRSKREDGSAFAARIRADCGVRVAGKHQFHRADRRVLPFYRTS
jgi:hypothetical protein